MRLERKQGLELACSLTFWRVRGKGRIFNGFMQPFGLLSHPVAPQAEAADIQRLRSRPALSRQEQCLCSQIQRLLSFFQGLFNSQMERILEVLRRASSLVREQELAATLMQIHLESHNCPEKSCKWGLGPDQAAGVTSALTGSSSPRFSWGSRFWAIQIHDSQSKI